METTVEGPSEETPAITRIVAGVLLAVWAIFFIVQTIGSPIVTLGSRWESYAYSVGIFIPVLVVLALAVTKSGRRT